jgi:hypothetical protein
LSAFLVGGFWYSPLAFGPAWKRANGFGSDKPNAANLRIFAIAFVLCLIVSANLAMFLNQPGTNLTWGATAGFLAGFGWIAMGIALISQFEGRPFAYVLVNGGYVTVALVLMDTILGAWR